MAAPRYETALIVGAGSGLSASLARAFAREGMRIALAARNIEKLAALSSETGALAFACDAANPDQVKRLFDGMEGQSALPILWSITRAQGRVGPLSNLARRRSNALSP